MPDNIPEATFIFVDRRRTGRGKSLPNREKLLRRIKGIIRSAKPADIDEGGNLGQSKSAQQTIAGPVRVAREALAEPTFHYHAQSGERDVILPGNDRWERGDDFPISGGDGEGEPQASNDGEDGEDDFIVNVSRDEFLNVFFEDCELPDLEQTSEKELPEAVLKPAGYQKDGNPGQLSVIRSYRQSLGRRRALNGSSYARIEEIQAEVQAYHDGTHPQCQHLSAEEIGDIIFRLMEELSALRSKVNATVPFEKVDLRYRKTEKVMIKQAQATLCMLMDVSGSMDEERKRLARRFFALQYAFITRKYPHTDLVFIYHTTEAQEVDEDEFFNSRKNGGTVISTAMKLANEILTKRYDAAQTNLYLSYAGDGDNWTGDNELVVDELTKNGLLAKLRHAVYIQVGEEMPNWGGGSGQTRFWQAMVGVANTNKKLHCVKVVKAGDEFSTFKTIYSTNKVHSK